MMIAETPNRSRVLTLNLKCSILPPVSPSTIIGLVVTSNISSIVEKREEKSTISISETFNPYLYSVSQRYRENEFIIGLDFQW